MSTDQDTNDILNKLVSLREVSQVHHEKYPSPYPIVDDSNIPIDTPLNTTSKVIYNDNIDMITEENNNNNNNNNNDNNNDNNNNKKRIEIYAFQYGKVTPVRIKIWIGQYADKSKYLKKYNKQNNSNVENPYPYVTTTFNVNTTTHIIICPSVDKDKMITKLHDTTRLTLQELKQKRISVVEDTWVCKWLEKQEIIDDTPYIFKYNNDNDNNDNDNDNNDNDNEQMKKKQKRFENDSNDSKNASYDNDAPTTTLHDYKEELIDALTKMYESYTAINDIFRGRAYQKASNVLKTFEGPIYRVNQLFNMKGIHKKGSESSIYKMMKEIIETGKSTMLDGRTKNPFETSVKLLKTVWGIGAVTAEKLVKNHGINTIEQLREAVQKGKVVLESGQLIGLNRFEDFNLRIPRKEVEDINEIVMAYAEKIVPGVQGTICGSYRRGKTDCGDVDILFVPPLGDEIMKRSFIAELVSTLAEDGYLTDHLSLPGDRRYHPNNFGKKGKRGSDQKEEALKYESSSDEDDDVADKKQKTYESNASGRQTSSYMGVFKLKKEDSHYRRIDFKAYPTQCYPFALLSFTGSGNFNRSMRYFVDKIGGHLSDNSLRLDVSRDPKTNEYIDKSGKLTIDIKTERDIFHALKLSYYEPHERNYFLKDADRDKIKDWFSREKSNSVNDLDGNVDSTVVGIDDGFSYHSDEEYEDGFSDHENDENNIKDTDK